MLVFFFKKSSIYTTKTLQFTSPNFATKNYVYSHLIKKTNLYNKFINTETFALVLQKETGQTVSYTCI